MVKWGSSFRSQTSSLYLHLAERVRELHAKSFQSCPILCNPIDGSPPSSPLPRILQARTLERVAISFSNTWKWSHSVVSDPRRPHGLQPSRLLYHAIFQPRVLEWGAIAFSDLNRLSLLFWDGTSVRTHCLRLGERKTPFLYCVPSPVFPWPLTKLWFFLRKAFLTAGSSAGPLNRPS